MTESVKIIYEKDPLLDEIQILDLNLEMDLILKANCSRLYSSEFLNNENKMQFEFQRLLNNPIPQTYEGYCAQVKAIGKFDVRNDLNKIQCPTLIINGAEDILTPNYLSIELHEGINNSMLYFIPNCGHMIPQEKSSLFIEYILDFFKEI